MHDTAVVSTLGSSWANDEHVIELSRDGRELTLYYLGRALGPTPPPAQGSRYARVTR